MRKALRTSVGMLDALTICCDCFVSGRIGGHDIDNLEMRLAALPDRLPTGDQHHRHAAQKPVCSAGDEVERPGPKRAERDPGFPVSRP